MSVDEIVKSIVEGCTRQRNDYSVLRTIDDAREYYVDNFSGMSRMEVMRDKENAGSGFYAYLLRKGWCGAVLPKSKKTDYSFIKTVDDAKRHYELRFAGMSRSRLQKDKKDGGCGFYHFLVKKEWNDAVLPESKNVLHRDYSALKTVDDARRYYSDNFAGMGRSELSADTKRCGGGFYVFLSTKGWRDAVLPESEHADYKDYSKIKTVTDAVRFYVKVFPGMSRTALMTHKGSGFYQFLKRMGWLDAVVPSRERSRRKKLVDL